MNMSTVLPADPQLTSSDQEQLLDMLEAITEIRVRNPELRASVLSSLRLTIAQNLMSSGRLYCLRFDGSIATIISNGDGTLNEDIERSLIDKATETREVQSVDGVHIWPLGHERRCYGVLVLEGCPFALGTNDFATVLPVDRGCRFHERRKGRTYRRKLPTARRNPHPIF